MQLVFGDSRSLAASKAAISWPLDISEKDWTKAVYRSSEQERTLPATDRTCPARRAEGKPMLLTVLMVDVAGRGAACRIIRSNRNAIVDHGARYRSGRRIATSLAESAVNSLVARRMVKNQQMRWSQKGAHLMLQVRAAVTNGDLRERYREKHDLSVLPLHPFFQPVPPLLQAA